MYAGDGQQRGPGIDFLLAREYDPIVAHSVPYHLAVCRTADSLLLVALQGKVRMSAPEEEARLVARAKRGDSAAVGEIYERHHTAVYRYVYYRVGDETLAEDLTATVFVRMVESIGRFQYRRRPLLTWLYTIARHAVIDHHRRNGVVGTIPLDERLLEGGHDVEEAVDRALTRERLVKAMGHLTEDQRQVVLLKFIEGLSNDQAARILGKTVGAVKSLQHRALAALERALTAERPG